MTGVNWSDSVDIAVRRLIARSGRSEFTRQEMIAQELERIVHETGSRGATPEMTLSRELQNLRDKGKIKFLGSGNYLWIEPPANVKNKNKTRSVFSVYSENFETKDRYYIFHSSLIDVAARSVGQWVLYQESLPTGQQGYVAIARVEQIVRAPHDPNMLLALIEPGSYLEFGQSVPCPDKTSVPTGDKKSELAPELIRPITDHDFDEIVELGLVPEREIPSRDDQENPGP